MNRNPYLLDRPAVVSFSGGLTSGLMLWKILESFGGTLPDDVKVIFNNTGKERPETLDFVERCSQRWCVPITWLEYRYEGAPIGAPSGEKRKTLGRHTFTVVDYTTASRNGEPFDQIIRARNMLPNVMARFCTVELKIRTSNRYLKSIGWNAGYTNAIGLRADEPQRVARLKGTNRHNREEPVAPLAEAGVTLEYVRNFWKSQPFRLELEPHEGNCDLCFLKGQGKIQRILSERPELAEWWIKAEAEAEAVRRGEMRIPSTAFFRKDRPRYAVQLKLAQRAGLFDGIDEPDELSIACHCTD